jgi:hypothetical protein
MLDLKNLDLVVSQVQDKVGSANMTVLKNLDLKVIQAQDNMGPVNLSDPK